MIIEAIKSLADRTGSSVPAIEKFIASKHGEVKKHVIKAALKAGLSSGNIAVHHIHKNSYKLGKPAAKAKAPAAKKVNFRLPISMPLKLIHLI